MNTVGGRISNPDRADGRDYADRIVRDGLKTYAEVLDWGVEGGVVSAAEAEEMRRAAEQRPHAAAAVHRRAVDVRESMYRLFKGVIEGWRPSGEDVAVLNRELAEARRRERLVVSEGSFAWRWDTDPELLDRVLWPVVVSAAELLTGPDLGRVGQCGGERCGWLFVDSSRGGRRRWCDMRVCGNRAKVRRYRERKQR